MLLVAYVADTERKVTFIYLFSETMGFFFCFYGKQYISAGVCSV